MNQNLTSLVRGGGDAVSLPNSEEESRLFTKNIETGVYQPVIDLAAFSNQHGLNISFHRKPLTQGCDEAIAARSTALSKGMEVAQELKAMALKTRDNSLVFIYMQGNYDLPRNTGGKIDYATLTQKTGVSIAGRGNGDGIVMGRINPITMSLKYPNSSHFFCMPDIKPDWEMYTNAGANTWGISIPDVNLLLKSIGAISIEGIAVMRPETLHGTPMGNELDTTKRGAEK